jgi:CheY-like chemotaxis protein
MKCLFIDDDKWFLSSFKGASEKHEIVLAECHSVADALEAVAKHKPDVVFLDHQLTEGGWEGLAIARNIKHLRVFSTTSDERLKPQYEAMGIAWVGKRLRSIMAVIDAL